MAGATSTSRHNYGTHINLNLLSTLTAVTVTTYGEDRVLAAIQRELDYHNELMRDAVSSFCEITTDEQRAVGTTAGYIEMDEIDEIGTPPAQKPPLAAGQALGFPLRKYGVSVQWTYTYFKKATPADLAITTRAILMADRRNVTRAINRTLFRPTNSTFRDRWGRNLPLAVKALANADSFPIPLGPNNEYFDPATHTHYSGIASATWNSSVAGDITTSAAALASAVSTVTEHYPGGEVLIYINPAQEAGIRRMTANFQPLLDVRLAMAAPTYPATAGTYVEGVSLNTRPVDATNRAIGLFGNSMVWLKPWVPAGYIYIFNSAIKPMAYRIPEDDSGDLQMVFEDELHPLRAQVFERMFGFGIQDRTAAAILNIGSGTYAWNDTTFS